MDACTVWTIRTTSIVKLHQTMVCHERPNNMQRMGATADSDKVTVYDKDLILKGSLQSRKILGYSRRARLTWTAIDKQENRFGRGTGGSVTDGLGAMANKGLAFDDEN